MGEVVAFPLGEAVIEALERPRWRAVAGYRTESAPHIVEWAFDEFSELADLVEQGPDWRCMVSLEIWLNRGMPGEQNLTLEQSARQ